MARRETLTVKVRIDGLRETLAVLRYLPTEATKSLRDRTLDLSRSLAAQIQAAAVSEGSQAALVAPTVKASYDRVPAVTAGGNRRVGKKRVQAHQVLFGSEFGQNRRTGWYFSRQYVNARGRQYKPHLGQHSYWFFRTVERNQREIATAWNKVATDITREFTRG